MSHEVVEEETLLILQENLRSRVKVDVLSS